MSSMQTGTASPLPAISAPTWNASSAVGSSGSSIVNSAANVCGCVVRSIVSAQYSS